MKLIKSLVYALLSMTTLAILASCQDEDFGYTAEDVKKGAFGRNFENEYGKIDPDQSWDLTNYMTRTAKYDDEALVDYLLRNGGQTRADGYYNPGGSQPLPQNLTGIELDDEYYYHVQPNTIKWLRNFLKEGKNNTSLGSAFSLRSPNNKIAIIPIYQGFANMDWSLWIRHNGSDTKLWSESENIKVSNDGENTWVDKGTTYGTSQTVYDHAIKSKPIIVDLGNSSVKEFNLFLKIDDNNGQDGYAATGTVQLSSMGMMLALPCPIPDNLGTTNVSGTDKQNLAMIVGAEDSDLAGSDWDMNDVCFLIVGFPELPNRIDITRKRYMCEDLGNTYDFDFNDIVVDVMEVITSKYEASSNLFKPADNPTQIATIKHVCGTLPFQVKVGNTTFNTVTDPTNETQTLNDLKRDVDPSKIVNLSTRGVNWNPEFSMRVEGWDHNENNVEVLVAVNSNSESLDVFADAFGKKDGQVTEDGDNHIYHITFPTEPGDAPLIIATDPTLMWMDEHTHIPEAWWKEGTFKPTGSADNDTPGTPGSGEGNENWADIPEHLVTPDADGNVVIWDAADHADAGNDEEKGIFEGWKGMQFQTEFLDALFEGYTIIEFQFGDGNTAQTFRLCKVTNNWETVIATPTISGGKATYTFSASALTDYNLGVAILNIGDSGKKMVVSKVVMKMPQSYTLTVNNGDYGTVTVNPAANSDGKYTEGTQVTLTVTPDEDWYFDQWSDGNKSNPRKVTISSDLELTPSYIDKDPFEAGNVTLHGTHTFDNGWTSFDIAKIDLNLHQGDVIVFRVTSFSADAKIEFFNLDWQSKRDVTPDGGINGSFLVEITEAMYNDYKEGLKIQGHNVALESVTKRCDHADPDPETPEEPENTQIDVTLGQSYEYVVSSWDNAAKISASQLSGIEVGDKLVITLKDVNNGAQMQVSEMSGNWSNKIVDCYDLNGSTSKEIEVTNDNINAIKNGIAIQGHDFTLVKVELVEKTGEDPEQPDVDPDTDQPVTLWTGNTTLNWNTDVNIQYSEVAKYVGKTLYVTYELVDAEYHSIRIINQDWSWDPKDDSNWNWSPTESGSINKEISQELINNLKNKNLAITGNGCKVTKIEAK